MDYSKREKKEFYESLTDEQKEIRLYVQRKKAWLKAIQKNKTPKHPYWGIEFRLSYDEVFLLLRQSDITWDDVGCVPGKYHLSRVNDVGHYEMGNCRYIPMEENRKEQKRNSKWIFRGKEYPTLPAIAEETGLSVGQIKYRMKMEDHFMPIGRWQ